MREAFTVQLAAGALPEWVRAHEHVWPELLETQRRCGFDWMDVYALGDTLIVVSETDDPTSWPRLIDTDIHRQWVNSLRHLSLSATSDDRVDRSVLERVLQLTWE